MPHKSINTYKLKRNAEERIKTPKTPLKGNFIDITKYENRYIIIEKIGSGDYCDVFLVDHKNEGMTHVRMGVESCERNDKINMETGNGLGVVSGGRKKVKRMDEYGKSEIDGMRGRFDLTYGKESKGMIDRKMIVDLSVTDKIHKTDTTDKLHKSHKSRQTGKTDRSDKLHKTDTMDKLHKTHQTHKTHKTQQTDKTIYNESVQGDSQVRKMNDKLIKYNLGSQNTNCTDKIRKNKYSNLEMNNSSDVDLTKRNAHDSVKNIQMIEKPCTNQDGSLKIEKSTKKRFASIYASDTNIENDNCKNTNDLLNLHTNTKNKNNTDENTVDLSKENISVPFYRHSFSTTHQNNLQTSKHQTPAKPSLWQKPYTLSYCLSDNLTCIKILSKKLKGPPATKEVDILHKLKGHAHCLQIKDHFIDTNLIIETEFCGFGSLKQLITKTYHFEKSKFTTNLIYKIMIELTDALMFIHSHNIIHMDLKPENVFIKSLYEKCVGECKCYVRFIDDIEKGDFRLFKFVIGDFNISIYSDNEMDEDGDKKYMPPEILLNQAFYSSDVYSLGLMFLELITGIELPEKGSQWMGLRKNLFGRIRWGGVEKSDKNMCVQMIDKNYKKRPVLKEVYEYFKERICDK